MTHLAQILALLPEAFSVTPTMVNTNWIKPNLFSDFVFVRSFFVSPTDVPSSD